MIRIIFIDLIIAFMGCELVIELDPQGRPDGGDGDGDGDADADGDGDGTCLGLGVQCVTSAECCTGRCELDLTGEFRCISASRCAGLGEPCHVAADCCSLGCEGQICVERLCYVDGAVCVNDAQCCSNWCEGVNCRSRRGCLPVGERCDESEGEACCSLNCVRASDGLMRCAGLGRCRSEGEVCTGDSDCCNYQCSDNGRCIAMQRCSVAGEACESSRECCSAACADDGSGFRSCQFLGGCRPAGELCREDRNCCNDPANNGPGVCEPVGDGIGRCGNPPGCAPAGELCGDEQHDCCPCVVQEQTGTCANDSGELFCQETVFGVSRCFSTDCVLEGGPCTRQEECCSEVCEGDLCAPGFACLPELSACAFSDQCCCRVCAPDERGELVCCPNDRSCVPVDRPCTTDADCCSGNCTLLGTCGPEETVCTPVGGSCDIDSDCCSGFCDLSKRACGVIY